MCLPLAISLGSCSYLLTPKVQQDFIKLRQGEYRLDASHTSVIFKVQHMQLSTYVGRFNTMDAGLNFDPQHPQHTQLDAWVDTGSVDVNNQKLEQSLRDSWFKSTIFPQASIKTLSVKPTDIANQWILNTELTLLGVSKPMTLLATFHGGANNLLTGYYTLGFSAKGKIQRSEFGMDQYIPMVGDEVTIEIYAEFQKR